jgi:ubiquinone/menaquinone biosynthesis C-methylase UbiE
MALQTLTGTIPLTGAKWAAKSEAYAGLVSEHLFPAAAWLDAGCGTRMLERDLESLENWLVSQCGAVVGMDLAVSSHRSIKSLVQGSIYHLPFPADSFDLITCRMVVEHLDRPADAFAEVVRCLRPEGAFIVMTPNLLNYGIFGNAVATKVLPEKLRLRIVHASDSRPAEDVFPVCYKANTMRRLVSLLSESGLQVHKTIALRQQRPYFRNHLPSEKFLMQLTPIHVLLVCAHKSESASASLT